MNTNSLYEVLLETKCSEEKRQKIYLHNMFMYVQFSDSDRQSKKKGLLATPL